MANMKDAGKQKSSDGNIGLLSSDQDSVVTPSTIRRDQLATKDEDSETSLQLSISMTETDAKSSPDKLQRNDIHLSAGYEPLAHVVKAPGDATGDQPDPSSALMQEPRFISIKECLQQHGIQVARKLPSRCITEPTLAQ